MQNGSSELSCRLPIRIAEENCLAKPTFAQPLLPCNENEATHGQVPMSDNGQSSSHGKTIAKVVCQGVWQRSSPEISSRQSLSALSLIRKSLWPLRLCPRLSGTHATGRPSLPLQWPAIFKGVAIFDQGVASSFPAVSTPEDQGFAPINGRAKILLTRGNIPLGPYD
jgi:hypothetical protein